MRNMPRMIAITSGKGGIGKSSFVLNVGISLAKMEFRVLLVDGDLGLANLDILMGIMPQKSLEDAILDRAELKDIILPTDYKIKLLPASSGLVDMADLPEERIFRLVGDLIEVSKDMDFILVDTTSGMASNLISFLIAVPEVIVGINPEPTSLTETYGLIKTLKSNVYGGKISVFSSMVDDYAAGHALFKKISSASQRFLDTQIEYVGPVCNDERLHMAIAEQVPVVVRFPTSDIARCYRVIATTLLAHEPQPINIERFWARFIHMVRDITRPQIMKEISFDVEQVKENSLEKTMDAILEEQRRTRLLLERLLFLMEGTQRIKRDDPFDKLLDS